MNKIPQTAKVLLLIMAVLVGVALVGSLTGCGCISKSDWQFAQKLKDDETAQQRTGQKYTWCLEEGEEEDVGSSITPPTTGLIGFVGPTIDEDLLIWRNENCMEDENCS